jgi:hypothetical protein
MLFSVKSPLGLLTEKALAKNTLFTVKARMGFY